jgi:protein ImuB
VVDDPTALEVLDVDGRVVGVDGRGAVSAPPASVVLADQASASAEVVAWAGPWPAEERWWDPASHRRRARLQLQLHDGRALLVHVEGGRWWLEAVYD